MGVAFAEGGALHFQPKEKIMTVTTDDKITEIDKLRADYKKAREANGKAAVASFWAREALYKVLAEDAADQIGRIIEHDEVRIAGFAMWDDALFPYVNRHIKSGAWGKAKYPISRLSFNHQTREWCDRDEDNHPAA
jgi:hypothetical protein